MALVFRSSIFKFPSNGFSGLLCKTLNNPTKFQAAGIFSKESRHDRPPKPPPFDYINKKYNMYHAFFDPMMERFDENTKIILIDGPVASGKNDLAKKLANELEMLYVPTPSFDELYVTKYGLDIRKLDHLLPPETQTCDIERFCREPNGINTVAFQFYFYYLRMHKYITILQHVLSTGQGVVAVRGPWSDGVFAETMHLNGYMSKDAITMYRNSVKQSIWPLMKPHLVIYLDVAPDDVLKKIKARGRPYEVNSSLFTQKYLSDMDTFYKEKYLKTIGEHAHLLVYDWTNEGDFEIVIEDIEAINFDKGYDQLDPKLIDWRLDKAGDFKDKRDMYCNEVFEILDRIEIIDLDCKEMLLEPQNGQLWDEVMTEYVPEYFYSPGYNPKGGDKNIMWKVAPRRLPDFAIDAEKAKQRQKAD